MPHDIPMTNMKMSAKEAREDMEPSMPDSPKYPWGLRITLNDEELKKLGVNQLPQAGSEMLIYAAVNVTESATMDTMDGGKSMRMELQITDLALLPKNMEENSPEKKLYG